MLNILRRSLLIVQKSQNIPFIIMLSYDMDLAETSASTDSLVAALASASSGAESGCSTE